MATRIVATGEVKDKLSIEDYRALLLGIGYGAVHAADVLEYLEESASARFTVYGTALRKGLIEKVGGKPLSEGTIVKCACGASYNDASAAMVRLHAGH